MNHVMIVEVDLHEIEYVNHLIYEMKTEFFGSDRNKQTFEQNQFELI